VDRGAVRRARKATPEPKMGSTPAEAEMRGKAERQHREKDKQQHGVKAAEQFLIGKRGISPGLLGLCRLLRHAMCYIMF
jgi:hypothetical protein